MKRIKEIFDRHHGNYGYRRITCVLRNEGMTTNHKKVKRLMKNMGLFGKVIQKRNHYSSYKGIVDKIAGNEINRHFSADQPRKKYILTLLEFKLNNGDKVYLSPILDGFNGEIIAYDISTSPNLHQT